MSENKLETSLKQKNSALLVQVNRIMNHVKEYLQRVVELYPEYTKHDIDHSEEVIRILDEIIPDELMERFTDYEIFILLSSAYLHDIGLCDLPYLFDRDKFIKFCEENKLPPNPEDKQSRKLFIREYHHERSERFVKYNKDLLFPFEENPANREKIAELVGLVCKGHRKINLDEYPEQTWYKGTLIRLSLLSALLRLADELDVSYKRAPSSIFFDKILNNENTSEETIREWLKSLSLDTVKIKRDGHPELVISGRVKDPEVYDCLKEWSNKVIEHLKVLEHQLVRAGLGAYTHLLPSNVYFEKEIMLRFEFDRLLNYYVKKDKEFIETFRPVIERDDHKPEVIKRCYKEREEYFNYMEKYLDVGSMNDLVNNPKIHLKIVFDKDLREVKFLDDKNSEICKLDEPKLLFECSCNIKDEYKYKRPCRLCLNDCNRRVRKLFGKKFTEISYDNVRVLWFDTEPEKGVDILWPPAIDSLYMAKVLLDNKDIIGNRYYKILDIGCGTGFLGIFFGKQNNYVREIHFSDYLLIPLLITKLNILYNKLHNKKCRIILSDGFRNIQPRQYDLVICNPPYLPPLDLKDLYGKTCVSGSRLFEEVVKNSGSYACELILGCSTLIKCKDFLEEFKNKGIISDFRPVGSTYIPFRISYIIESSEYSAETVNTYLKMLLKDNRIYKRNKRSYPFKYWHKFEVYHIHY